MSYLEDLEWEQKKIFREPSDTNGFPRAKIEINQGQVSSKKLESNKRNIGNQELTSKKNQNQILIDSDQDIGWKEYKSDANFILKDLISINQYLERIQPNNQRQKRTNSIS